MISITPPDYNEICQRWHQATVANNYLKWRAISSWLAAVSIMCNVDDAGSRGKRARGVRSGHAARAGHPAGAGNGGCMNPPVTYCMNLDDLTLMADAACELDGYKYLVTDEASAQRIEDMVTRMHDAVERAAGVACGMIYHEEDGRGSLDYNVVKRFFAEKLASDFENIEERKRYTPRKLLHLYKEEVD